MLGTVKDRLVVNLCKRLGTCINYFFIFLTELTVLLTAQGGVNIPFGRICLSFLLVLTITSSRRLQFLFQFFLVCFVPIMFFHVHIIVFKCILLITPYLASNSSTLGILDVFAFEI